MKGISTLTERAKARVAPINQIRNRIHGSMQVRCSRHYQLVPGDGLVSGRKGAFIWGVNSLPFDSKICTHGDHFDP